MAGRRWEGDRKEAQYAIVAGLVSAHGSWNRIYQYFIFQPLSGTTLGINTTRYARSNIS